MAWNQPGGDGRDPWNDRGGQRGPPDLDEVLRKVQARLGQLFGGRPGRRSGSGGGGDGGSGAGGGGRGGGIGALGVGIVAALVVLAWGAYGIYVVDPAEAGVVLRFGQYVRTTGPGPHWVPPFVESVEKVNVQVIRSQDIGFRTQGSSSVSVAHESLMLTEDENIIDIKFAVQYRVKDPAAFLFNVVDPEITLRQATESAVREIVGRSGMDFVITEGRNAVAVEAQALIQDILDRYGSGLNVTSVNMQNAQPPDEVQEAFFDAIKAREDQERIINEANAYKADIVPKARGEAQAIEERAEAYRQRVIALAEGETSRFLQVLTEYHRAPEITRERLYLEAVESVMANSSKVLVDVQGGNNLMYLPLDRLLTPRPGEGQNAGSEGAGYADPGRPTRSRDGLSGRSLE
jgi:membrane protease subunit HflK